MTPLLGVMYVGWVDQEEKDVTDNRYVIMLFLPSLSLLVIWFESNQSLAPMKNKREL